MGLQSFATFQALVKGKHYSKGMGFAVGAGDINILANRMRVARSFRGIDLEGYSNETKLGYDAFFQVFLTHAALERFCYVIGVTTQKNKRPVYCEQIVTLTQPHKPELVIQEFCAKDTGDRLFTFIDDRLDSPGLKKEFRACKEGRACNVPAISAAIRHIFAHGHLTAHANKLNTKRVHGICMNVSNFVLDFIDAEFSRRISDYCTEVGFVRPERALVLEEVV